MLAMTVAGAASPTKNTIKKLQPLGSLGAGTGPVPQAIVVAVGEVGQEPGRPPVAGSGEDLPCPAGAAADTGRCSLSTSLKLEVVNQGSMNGTGGLISASRSYK